jgi:transcriptional regulator GlxA family with amidase domain
MSSVGPIRVAFVAFEGVSILDLSGPLEAMRVASTHPNHLGPSPIYDCSVLSVRGGPVMTADGLAVVTDSVASVDGRAIDTLIALGAFNVEDTYREHELIDWVLRRAPECRRVCSVCVGTFLLAAAGLLDGRRAVTHWRYCNLLSSRYPKITVEPDAIYLRDGKIWTSAGVTTGIDLALALIEQDCGRAVAMHVARVLVVYLRRMGGQSQYSAPLAAQVESTSDVFGELERWIAENLTADLRVERLAERVGMSPRNFARRYTETRKRTPARAVDALRVEAARRALVESDDRINEIAERCGFTDEERMRNAFARHLGITPRAYRHRFAAA